MNLRFVLPLLLCLGFGVDTEAYADNRAIGLVRVTPPSRPGLEAGHAMAQHLASLLLPLQDRLAKAGVSPDIHFRECGMQNAFYDSSRRAVVMCHELAQEFLRRAQARPRQASEAISHSNRPDLAHLAALGAFTFTFFHEIGHAAVDMLNLPALGKEEDIADQFAVMAAASLGDDATRQMVGGAALLLPMPLALERLLNSSRTWADEHSVGPQRRFNMICWAFGLQPHRQSDFARYWRLPVERAQRCPAEAQQMADAFERLMPGFFKRF